MSQRIEVTGDVTGDIIQIADISHPIGTLPPASPRVFVEQPGLNDFLDRFLAEDTIKDVCVSGMSGVGKTSGVSQWLQQKISKKQLDPQRVQYLDLRGVAAVDDELLARLVLAVMQSPVGRIKGEILTQTVLAQWRSWCHQHLDLIIYDGIEAPDLVADLRTIGTAKSIFASTIKLTEIDASFSFVLLGKTESTGLVRSVFEAIASPVSAEQAKRIAAVCEGLPLALQAAAATLAQLDPSDLEYGIEQFIQMASMRNLSEHWDAKVTRRLTACILLLPTEKRQLWAALAQFESPFFIFQAKTLWNFEVQQAASVLLSQFLNRSLIQKAAGLVVEQEQLLETDPHTAEYAHTYQMHRLFRTVAAELYPANDTDRSGYGRAVFETVGRANHFSRTTDYDKLGFALNRHIIADKYPGFEALATTEDVSEAEFLTEFPIFGVHQMDVPPARRLEWLDQAAEVLTTRLPNSENYLKLLLKVRASQAQQLDELAQYDEALQVIDDVYSLTDANTDERASLDTLKAMVLGHAGTATRALRYNTKALKHWIIAGNDRERSTAYNNRGLLFLGINDLKRAVRFCEISLTIDREQGLDGDAAFNLQNLAQMYSMMHQNSKAAEKADEAERICLEFDNQSLLPGVYQVQGGLAFRETLRNFSPTSPEVDSKALRRAIDRYEKALEIEQLMGRPVKIIAALQNLAAAALYLENDGPQRAANLNAEAINLSIDHDIPWASVTARRNLGHILYLTGNTRDAVTCYEDAFAESRARPAAFEQLQIIDGLTDILLREYPARHHECSELLVEGIALAEKSGLPQFIENFIRRMALVESRG